MNFLLEIGTEELPSRFIKIGLNQLKEKIEEILKRERIKYGEVKTFGTPRRLAIVIFNLSEKGEDKEELIIGPPAKIGFKEGKFTKNAEAFAKSKGIPLENLKIIQTEEVLKENLKNIILSIDFPKSMRWTEKKEKFARPVRWILSLLENKIIEFEIFNIRSSNYTFGHRLLANRKIEIKNAIEYEEILEKEGKVIADWNKRKKIIKENLKKEAQKIGGKVVEDEELLEEVTGLVEYPVVFCGKFPSRYLDLPQPVIITAMKEHQRYFAVVDENNKIMPYFLCVANSDKIEKIKSGYERVLKARLEDAEFYLKEDLKKNLRDYLEDLKGIVWWEGLGNMYEKVMRIKKIVEELVKNEKEIRKDIIEEGILLSKIDLATQMIRDGKEFTKLQGIIGKEYAIKQGYKKEIADIIWEHYLPRFPGDELPKSKEATFISLADKLDTIFGLFKLGFEVKGSEDPYGLRRIIYALIDLIIRKELNIDLAKTLKIISKNYGNNGNLETKILKSILNRFEAYLQEKKGIRYDIVDCVIASGTTNIYNLFLRASVLQEMFDKDKETFKKVVIGQKRVANILKKVKDLPDINEKLFEKKEEKDLYKKAKEISGYIEDLLEKWDFKKCLDKLFELRPFIDNFFDNVFVMVENEKIRKNRLALLNFVKEIFRKYGDFSKIEI